MLLDRYGRRPPIQGTQTLSFLHLNMRNSSICGHLLVEFLRRQPVDVLMLQDTCDSLRTRFGGIAGYSLFLPSRHGGGCSDAGTLVGVLVKTPLRARPIAFSNQRMCGVFVDTPKGEIAFISAYIHYRQGRGLEALSAMVTEVRRETPFVLVGADTNGHSRWWGPPGQASNATGELVEDFVITHSLEIENRWPAPATFSSDRGFEAWLDVTMTSSRLHPLVSSWRVMDTDLGSDHRAILGSIATCACRGSEVDVRLDWRSVCWDSFRHALRARLQSILPEPGGIGDEEDLQRHARLLTEGLQTVIDQYVPTKRISWASNSWWSKELEQIRLELLRRQRKWNRTKDRADKREVNACRRHLRRAIAEAKQASWRRMCEDASDEDLWATFRKLMRPRHAYRMGDLRVGDSWISDEAGKARALADRFFPTPPSSDIPVHEAVHTRVTQILTRARATEIPDVSRTELHAAIWASGPWKAPGADRVTNACLRECEDILTPYLLPLLSASLRLQSIPSEWKSAMVVAVPKPGGDVSLPKGYRPISLLSCLSKVLERIVTVRLTYFLETSSALSGTQFGFRRMRSTDLALWNFVSATTCALQTRQKTVMLALDIEGAYDRVWHEGLLAKLADLAVPPALVGWIHSFLSDRSMSLRVGEVVERRRLSMGVPQGSPLSPILFLVFIDDLVRELSQIAHAQAFADDVVVWWHARKGDSGEAVGRRVLGAVERWSREWRAIFNPSKCQPMMISRQRGEPLPILMLHGSPLVWVDRLRYLGVWFDPTLSWGVHVDMVSRQALDRLRAIHRGVGTLWGLHPMIVSRMIVAGVLPALFYAAPAWCGAVRHLARLRPLDRVLRLCGMCTFGLLRTVSGDAARTISGLLSAEFQLRSRVVNFYMRQLAYDRDLRAGPTPPVTVNQMVSPREILDLELRQLGRAFPHFCENLARVERQRFWVEDPAEASWTPPISILPAEAAVERIRHARRHCTMDTLWIFTDGSVEGTSCGAAAVCFWGTAQQPHTFSTRFIGPHSSTQAELVALDLGCRRAREIGSASCVTIVSDSQAALMAIGKTQGGSSLAVTARHAIRTLELYSGTLRIWWTPSHVDLSENDMADAAAKAAAVGTSFDTLQDVPVSATILRSKVKVHYATRTDTQWGLSDTGRDLHEVMPRLAQDLMWTHDLSRKDAALTAQFLSGHYATQAYLRRFGHPVDGSCRWCDGPLDDREHRLFHCPRFEFLRQQLRTEIEADTHGSQTWEWDFLTGLGRRYLSRFLRVVHSIVVPHAEDEGE